MTRVTNLLLKFMVNNEVITTEEDVLDFYRYGIEITISTVFSMMLITLLGIITHCFFHSLTFLVTFIFIRSYVGGFHADTYFRCSLLMCVSFICTTFLSKTLCDKVDIKIEIALSLLFLIVVAIFGPVENVNKPIPDENKLKLKS